MKLYYCLAISLILHISVYVSLFSYEYEKMDGADTIAVYISKKPEHASNTLSNASEENKKPEKKTTFHNKITGEDQKSSIESGDYLHSMELDENPVPLSDIKIDVFNQQEIQNDIYAILFVYINKYGIVDKAEVKTSSIPPKYEEKIIAIFRASRFSPGKKNGNAVNSIIKIEVGYKNGSNPGF